MNADFHLTVTNLRLRMVGTNLRNKESKGDV
jgi:hypothetical protein